jgi:PhnB protein
MNIPPNNQAVMPYLILKNVPAFIDFTAKVFGGRLLMQHNRPDNQSVIMHAEIDIHGSTLMCAEAIDPWQPQPAGMFVYVEDADISFAKAVALGAEVIMGLSDQEYGRTCGVKDICGNIWWITAVL